MIAEPDAAEQKVTEAVNDTLKAIAASLLMEQVLIPKFEFVPKSLSSVPRAGYDYGPEGFDPGKNNVGFNPDQGCLAIDIKGLKQPKTEDAERVCREDLNELVATFVQDKPTLERGLFDPETVPEELTVAAMGKIVADKYPHLEADDQEAVRQRAIAALTFTQQAKQSMQEIPGMGEPSANTAFVDGVRKFAMDVRELDIDLIDSINPFGEAYSILSKTMSEDSLKQISAIISAKKVKMTLEEARVLAKRALSFKKERGRVPSLTSSDPWEVKMAEGVAVLSRMAQSASQADPVKAV